MPYFPDDMKYLALALSMAICTAPPPLAADSARAAGSVCPWIEDTRLRDTITSDETHSYYLSVRSDTPRGVVAIARGESILVSLVNCETGFETGAVAVSDQVAEMVVPPGEYLLYVESTGTTEYELLRLPVQHLDELPRGRPSSDVDEVPSHRWPEGEVPELIRWASGVLGSKWRLESRSYKLQVASGYRANLSAHCQTGAFEAMVIPTSGPILPLLLPQHAEDSLTLEPGKYLVYLIGHADASAFSLEVTMRRAVIPGARRSRE